jgi:uncharacterized protein (DUF1501 family)
MNRMTLTRRDFVKGGLAGASLAFFSTRLGASVLANAEEGRTLVILQLIGGNDTLNTFIPYTDPRYRAVRPTLAIPDNKILQADSRLGFHPSMKELHELYQRGEFAFVTNVGFPTVDRSHFYCQDVWQSGRENPVPDEPGWIGRWADLYAPSSFSPATLVGVAASTPRGLIAKRVFPTCLLDVNAFKSNGDSSNQQEASYFVSSIRNAYGIAKSDPLLEAIREQGSVAFAAIDMFNALPAPSTLAGYPIDSSGVITSLGHAMRFAAQLIAGGTGMDVIWISFSGFDTHRDQVSSTSASGGTHASLLREMSASLGAFQRDIENRGVADRVTTMVWSEFGRRVEQNASFGTDHGRAGSVMLLGNHVKGGQWYGDPYDLADLDEGDLKPRIDFRSIYATLIRDWLGGDPRLVLGQDYEQIGFLDQILTRRRAVQH